MLRVAQYSAILLFRSLRPVVCMVCWAFWKQNLSSSTQKQNYPAYGYTDQQAKDLQNSHSACFPSYTPPKSTWREIGATSPPTPFLLVHSQTALLPCFNQIPQSLARWLEIKGSTAGMWGNNPLVTVNGELPQERLFFLSCVPRPVSIELEVLYTYTINNPTPCPNRAFIFIEQPTTRTCIFYGCISCLL